MADTKISALTSATTPLAGTEVLPIVQSGATVKVSVANLTAGRAVATAGGSFTDNITQSTAAKGINFTANSAAAGKTSQLLNWYEEGTWTPAQGSGLTLVGAFSSSGTYVRIGRMVTVTGLLQGATSIAVAAGGVITNNLPYSIGTGNAVGRCLNSAWTSACDIIPSAANLYGATVIGATSYIFFSVTYQV